MSFTPPNALVWCEIPVTDLARAVTFYNAAFTYDLQIDNTGPNPIAFLPMVPDESCTAGHIYPGKPAAKGTGPTVHLAVPDTVEATAERIRNAGGETLDMVVDIPAGRFGYAIDPDGNSLGLFQPTG